MKYLILFIYVLFSGAASAVKYPLGSTLCGAYPQAQVGTAKGVCVGVVTQRDQGARWVKPRRIVQVPGTQQFLVTDMGGWQRGKGVVWLVDTKIKPATHKALLTQLKLPHGLELGPDGRFYVGESHRIFRFTLQDKQAMGVETVVRDLPDFTRHSHPLSHFIFDQQGNLIVNIGAPSDQCKEDAREVFCRAVNNTNETQAAVRRYRYLPEANRWAVDYEVVASGVRNSMALASHESGVLLQAENSIDLPELKHPFEEINRIDTGGFYGWPYCYDNKKINRLWPTYGRQICHDPQAHKQPWVLMPAHAAPLDMHYYQGAMFPSLKDTLLVSWHGYRKTGHRLVAYKVDEKGLPIRSRSAYYMIDSESHGRNHSFSQVAFPPVDNIAQAQELISKMNAVQGVRPRGRPAGMTVAEDGAIWLLDDVNKALLRIAKGNAYQATVATDGATTTIPVKSPDMARIFLTRCQACHQLPTRVDKMHIPKQWLQKNNQISVLEQRVFHSPMRPMPPDTPLTEQQRQVLKRWLATM